MVLPQPPLCPPLQVEYALVHSGGAWKVASASVLRK